MTRWTSGAASSIGVTFLFIAFFSTSAILFSTSMLSTSTVLPNKATVRCRGMEPVDQVILVVIDAMRPDFVLSSLRPYARVGGRCDDAAEAAVRAAGNSQRYTGATIQYIEEALRSPDDASVGFFLVADAPTTTAQRLKAIATGSMPAFLEAGSNFNSEAIELDSIIHQMQGSAVLLGDDTWEKLFPNTANHRHWKKSVGIPSFDVADFDTNDDAVLAEVYGTIDRETAERAAAKGSGPHVKLVVAHFLGVDHVGHRINAENWEMDRKLNQFDAMLRNLSHTLRHRDTAMNTMLLVLGDHGMTNSGDHGGDSALETDTFLFAQLFKGKRNFPTSHQERRLGAVTYASQQKRRRVAALTEGRWSDGVDAEFERLQSCQRASGIAANRLAAAYQVDITPTISVLLGKPIPFSSFGRVIPEVVALADENAEMDTITQCNYDQLQRYFSASEMKLPRAPSWQQPELSVTKRIADMSFFARRTRTDMSRSGMLIGSTGLLFCAMTLLWSPQIKQYFRWRLGDWLAKWTVAVLLLRYCLSFSNSFVVNESSELLGLLSSMLLWIALSRVAPVWNNGLTALFGSSSLSKRRPAAAPLPCRDIIFLAVLLIGLRLGCPFMIRYRAHITHAVETESAADRLLAPVLSASMGLFSRAGIVVAGLLWRLLYPDLFSPLLLSGSCAVLCIAYHVPVAHHLAPIGCLALHFVLPRRCSGEQRLGRRLANRAAYAYFMVVLWLTTLCNEKVVTACVAAVYGASLPFLCRVLASESLLVQTVVLHLASYVAFFAEGHQCMLNTIDWNASFVGLSGYNLYAGGVLVISRTFHTFLLVPAAIALAAVVEEASSAVAVRRYAPSVVSFVWLHLLVVQTAVSCFNGYIQKTHLMLYPIFCPKFIFDAVIALVSAASVLLCEVVAAVAPVSNGCSF